MKIKFKNVTTGVTTVESSYSYEIGDHYHTYTTAVCGNCGKSVEEARFYQEWNYCPYCGTPIDWPEEEKINIGG